ncbi:MAG: DUF881 domain-containing protein [Bacillota bacterium]|nr:DUF881 domain-containing protein [Bacillota bacterium]
MKEGTIKKAAGRFGMFLITLIFGFLVMLQFKSVKIEQQSTLDSVTLRANELQTQLNKQKDTNEKLYKEILEYKDQLYQFRDEAAKSGNYASALSNQLQKVELTAGITAVKGPGVTVTMTEDPNYQVNVENVDPSYTIIHDDDVLKVLNELRDAGAEALSVNGERILATSEIRCAGSTISVNNNRYSAPFIITAIGDPDNLKSALSMRYGVIEILKQWGITVDVKTHEDVEVPAYAGPIQYKYAKPVENENSSH